MTDIAKNLEKTLSEKVIILSDIQDLKLEDNSSLLDSLNMLCENKTAYRLGEDKYVGHAFLWNFILDHIKIEKDVRDIKIEGISLGLNIVSKMLASMEDKGLIKKENSVYLAVLDKLLSKDIILKYCWSRVDKIRIEDILKYFHFTSINTERKLIWYKPAFIHCQKIIDQLCIEGKLQKFETNDVDFFTWTDI